MEILKIRRKAFAYVTAGTRLLVFTHPDSSDAGIQVPKGTVEPGESTADAAVREAMEESGLTSLRLNRWLGRQLFDAHTIGRDEFHDRWFYHLECEDAPRERWRHGESSASNGSHDMIPFEFFWVDLREEIPTLIAGHDHFVDTLRGQLGI